MIRGSRRGRPPGLSRDASARFFVGVRCSSCGQDLLVAFPHKGAKFQSCKERGFCPSCTPRRAAETAAHLVDAVLPRRPYRQWVLSLPFDLNNRVARDGELETALLDVCIEEMTAHLRHATGQPHAHRCARAYTLRRGTVVAHSGITPCFQLLGRPVVREDNHR